MSHITIDEFADRIHEIMPVLTRTFTRQHAGEFFKSKITLPQLFVLEFLYKEGDSGMTKLAHFLNVATPTITGIVDRLVRAGYLKRLYLKDDRRIINVTLTESGSQLVKKIHKQRRDMTIKVFGKISEADRRDYLRILTKIKDVLTKEDSKLE